jgi:hypothetical protein
MTTLPLGFPSVVQSAFSTRPKLPLLTILQHANADTGTSIGCAGQTTGSADYIVHIFHCACNTL